jgi:2-amino-4-hydroxy-6-hydroxymethyldihydropteridine diphosphokinase
MANTELINKVYIGLGANLQQPEEQLHSALEKINLSDDITFCQCSSFYQSAPMGPQDQDDYINAVALLKTTLTPLALLDFLQSIELQQGRVRKSERWGARTLDLDILLFNNEKIDLPRLIIPHYGIKQRNFVLVPLAELAPDLIFPDGTPIAQLISTISQQGLKKL